MDQSGETSPVVWAGHPAWSTYVLLWIFAAIFAVRGIVSLWMGYWYSGGFHFLVIALLSGVAVFLRQTTRYRITRETVYRTKGILGKAELSFPIGSLDKVSIRQGPLERLFHSGTVFLHFKTGVTERLTGIHHPEIVCNKIRALL